MCAFNWSSKKQSLVGRTRQDLELEGFWMRLFFHSYRCMLKWKANSRHSTLSYYETCEEFRWISWKFEQILNLMKIVREDMRWLAITREYGRVPLNPPPPPLFICCWNCTSHLGVTDSYSKALDLVMYQHVLFALISEIQRGVYNNCTSCFLIFSGFTVTQNNTMVSNTSNVASDQYGKF